MSRPEPEDRAPLVYVGATVGWAAGEVFPGIFVDVMDRVGNRGATRAAAAVALIEGDATEREARGEAVREDGFFDARGDERLSQAEELLEAVLRQAADAVEEEKLPFLARIYTAVERDPDVSPAEAHYLLGLAGRLTYRQLVALSVLSHHDEQETRSSPPRLTRRRGRSSETRDSASRSST